MDYRMFKKILFSLIYLAAMPAYSMNAESQPLVKKTQHIYIGTPRTTKKIWFPINESTTVLHLKQQLEAKEGVPFAQQSLFPLYSSWHSLWVSDHLGPKLQNSQNIQDVIGKYSNLLLLITSSQKHS